MNRIPSLVYFIGLCLADRQASLIFTGTPPSRSGSLISGPQAVAGTWSRCINIMTRLFSRCHWNTTGYLLPRAVIMVAKADMARAIRRTAGQVTGETQAPWKWVSTRNLAYHSEPAGGRRNQSLASAGTLLPAPTLRHNSWHLRAAGFKRRTFKRDFEGSVSKDGWMNDDTVLSCSELL